MIWNMWERFRHRIVRQQRNGEVNPQTTVQSAQPPKLSEPSNPAPPLAADNSPGVPTDDNAASQQPGDLAQARVVAQWLLANEFLLPPLEHEALRGLLTEDPTPDQVKNGMAALYTALALDAVVSDVVAARREASSEKLPESLRAWYRTPSWPASRRWLANHLSEIPPDGPALLDAAAEQARSAREDEDGARSLARHAELLREARRVGVDAAYRAKMENPEDAFPKPDDSEPSWERKAQLRAKYDANVKAGKPPYASVIIRTLGEVKWIMREREWRTGTGATREQTIDFRQVVVRDAVLSDFDFSFADLSGAEINDSTFSGAKLSHTKVSDSSIHDTDFSDADWSLANLSGVWMTDCTFTGTELILSNLSGAIILNCTFTRTKLTFANLSGAGISGDSWCFFSDVKLEAANLSGAELLRGFKDSDEGSDLTRARMDSATVLGDSSDDDGDVSDSEGFQFGKRPRLLDVAWNGAILANVWWKPLRRLGDEADIKKAKPGKDRAKALHKAARAYRGLAKALQAQGLSDPALRYRAREQQLERRARLHSFDIGGWVFSWLLNIVSGYGDRPGRSLRCYVAVIVIFMAVYWAITNQVFGFIASHSAHLAWYEALVLSISSFHGRGFFPATLTLGDPVALVAAAEAIIGLFIELVFIATFTQRFFAR